MTDSLGSSTTMKIKLQRVSDSQIVDADIAPLSGKHLDDFATFWKPRLSDSQEEDSHWDWIQKWKMTHKSVSYESYAVEADFITQGLMLIEVDFHRSRTCPKQGLVYLDFLATAPWNRPNIEDPPQFKGVGSALYQFAIQRSLDLEYKGRVGLHALPNAEAFYHKQGLQDFGIDPEKQNLRYFELSEMNIQ